MENHNEHVNTIQRIEKIFRNKKLKFFLSEYKPIIGPIIAINTPVKPIVQPQYDWPRIGLGAISFAKYVAKINVIMIVLNAELAKSYSE